MSTLLRVLTIRQASDLVGKSPGCLRRAISRGLLTSAKDKSGKKNVLHSYNLASYLIYGLAYPEEKMSKGQKEVLHAMLWSLYPCGDHLQE